MVVEKSLLIYYEVRQINLKKNNYKGEKYIVGHENILNNCSNFFFLFNYHH